MRSIDVVNALGSCWSWYTEARGDVTYLDMPSRGRYIISENFGFGYGNAYASFEDAYADASKHFEANIIRNISGCEAAILNEREADFRAMLEKRLAAWKDALGTEISYTKRELDIKGYWNVCNAVIPKDRSIVYALIAGQSEFTKITVNSAMVSSFASMVDTPDGSMRLNTPCVEYGIESLDDGCDRLICHKNDNDEDVFTLYSENGEIAVDRIFMTIDEIDHYLAVQARILNNLTASAARISFN